MRRRQLRLNRTACDLSSNDTPDTPAQAIDFVIDRGTRSVKRLASCQVVWYRNKCNRWVWKANRVVTWMHLKLFLLMTNWLIKLTNIIGSLSRIRSMSKVQERVSKIRGRQRLNTSWRSLKQSLQMNQVHEKRAVAKSERSVLAVEREMIHQSL